MTQIPMDQAVRKGVLPNGLTYYIRQNQKPENQAEFYIYHDVGAIQEEDDQQGLAHFLEHMSFNGTKNLPGKQLINWLESVGVKFGANLNAGTGVEATTYMMKSVPTIRESIIDSALLILHDWSNFVALEDDEIDAERGVIVEELRQGNSARRRIMEKSMPYYYGDTKYAHRNVIGNEEGLRTFTYQQLRDFYHRWYRTDMQCIVVVGDIDVDKIESKIKTLFADVEAVANPEPKAVIEIPDNEKPIVAILTDPELTSTSGAVLIKRKPLPKEMNSTIMAEMINMLEVYATQIINERLATISQQPNPPFMMAFGSLMGSMTNTCDASQFGYASKDGESLKGLETVLEEIEKVVRYGFTQSEFDRAKAELENQIENQYKQRDDRRNNSFVGKCISNFSDNQPIPDAKTDFEVDSMLLANVNVAAVNQFVKTLLTPTNRIVMLQMPAKEGAVIPTETEVEEVIARVEAADLQGYEEEGEKKPLIPEGTVLKGSKIKKSTTDKFGATVWTLKNGATVVVYPTEFKANDVSFTAAKFGGTSTLADEDLKSAGITTSYMSMSGLGEFSSVELSKQLSGKEASVGKSIGQYSSGLSGSCVPKDMETMMQLLYLNFTAPRFDKDIYGNLMQQMETSLRNQEGKPSTILQDSLLNVLYDHNPRTAMTKLSDMDKFNEARCHQINAKFFGGVSGYTFTFVGNIDLDEFKPLVEKYIGSLPATKVKSEWKEDGAEMVSRPYECLFDAKMETPKATVTYVLSGPMEYNLKNELVLSTLKQILRVRYTAVIREEKGGTYGVSVGANLSILPKGQYMLTMQFDTDPARADELRPILISELETIANEGPKAEDLAKIKEYSLKQHPDNLKDNGSWRGWIQAYHLYGLDMVSNYTDAVNQLSSDDIKAMARKILDDGNIAKFVMSPKTEAAE